MVTGKKGPIQCAAWLAMAIIGGACGGQARSSSERPALPAVGGTPSSGSEPTEGLAGSVRNAAGGTSGSAGVASSPTVTPGGGSGSGPSSAEGGQAGEAPATCAADAQPLQAELLWQDAFPFYGSSDYPFIGFSPDGEELLVPIPESPNQQGNRRYGVQTGEQFAQPLPAVLGRDPSWSRQLLSIPGSVMFLGSVAEVASGEPLLSLGTGLERPLQVRLSDDGQYVFRLSCEAGLRVERVRISDGEVSSVALGDAESLCVGYGHPTFIVPLTASRANDQVLVGAERRGFALANFASGSAIFSVPPDEPSVAAERKPNQPLPSDAVTLELSPEERTLATIDASGTLRLVSYPDLVPSSPDITTAVSSAFAHGYVTPRTLAPVAWSPDERYLATADDSHATVVRRACDGSVAVTLPAPIPDPTRVRDDQHWVPAFLAFNRRGLALAVLRVNEQFRATVSYYALSVASPN
jgi:hypothetical protein